MNREEWEELQRIKIELQEVGFKLASGLHGNDYKDMLAIYKELARKKLELTFGKATYKKIKKLGSNRRKLTWILTD